MSVRITVVVPVYNPGASIDPCIRSILEQSLPQDEFETIFVDDGSTDETPARLDALAADRPSVRVIHQPNSGWPGRPRNVGRDAARGDYVFFLDQDDWLGQEALARMLAMADRNAADVVVPKMVGHGRLVTWRRVFAENRDSATLHDSALIEALTPHKLFRRAFLDANAIRFPEGRRRLEDYPFVLRSYFLARRISILADYVCYVHTRRRDQQNASLQRIEPAGYYTNLGEAVDVVEAFTSPGAGRDRLLARFARIEVADRLRGRRLLDEPPEYREALFRNARAFVLARIPESVDPLLPPVHRVVIALLRAGRLDLIEDRAPVDRRIRADARLTRRPVLAGGVLHLAFEGGLVPDGCGPRLERGQDGWRLSVAPEVAAAVPEEARRVGGDPAGTVLVLVRRRGDSAEFAATPAVRPKVVAVDGGADMRYRVRVAVDPRTASLGRALPAGRWRIVARFEAWGYGAEAPLELEPLVIDANGSARVKGAIVRSRREHELRRVFERLPRPLRSGARAIYRGVRPLRPFGRRAAGRRTPSR